jgi:hypothetical protein
LGKFCNHLGICLIDIRYLGRFKAISNHTVAHSGSNSKAERDSLSTAESTDRYYFYYLKRRGVHATRTAEQCPNIFFIHVRKRREFFSCDLL